MKPATHLLALLLTLLATACVTPPAIDWDSRVGTHTFDATLTQLGPPDKSATLTDGTRIAEWLVQRGTSTPTYHTFPDGRVLRTEGVRGPDRWLQLTFNPDGKLKQWKRLWR